VRRAAVSGDRAHVDVLTITMHRKLYDAVGQCEERVIFPHADVLAGANARSALADQDVARNDGLPAEPLDAQALRVRVAAVPGGTGALFGSEKLKVEEEHGRSTIAQAGAPLQDFGRQASARGPRLGAP
jgi:hypothetical protein